MYAVSGITGQVGGACARSLLAANRPVRAVLRDPKRADAWARRGCEVAYAEFNDPEALSAAFAGADGAFVMLPSLFDPTPGFPEARALCAVLRAALDAAQPGKVVCLSTIGANVERPNLLNQLGMLEPALGTLDMPVAFLRRGWFMENFSWDVAPARDTGVVPSFLQPLDKTVPMVATADVGRVAAELLQEDWSGKRIVELEGPRRVSPNDVAAAFSKLLGRPVRMEAVPRETWSELFSSQGMKNPTPRVQMLDGFNQGWIEFADSERGSRKGAIEIETVLKGLVESATSVAA
jgi:NAD(P)H dehydrogenase (quinone)